MKESGNVGNRHQMLETVGTRSSVSGRWLWLCPASTTRFSEQGFWGVCVMWHVSLAQYVQLRKQMEGEWGESHVTLSDPVDKP